MKNRFHIEETSYSYKILIYITPTASRLRMCVYRQINDLFLFPGLVHPAVWVNGAVFN